VTLGIYPSFNTETFWPHAETHPSFTNVVTPTANLVDVKRLVRIYIIIYDILRKSLTFVSRLSRSLKVTETTATTRIYRLHMTFYVQYSNYGHISYRFKLFPTPVFLTPQCTEVFSLEFCKSGVA